MTTTVTRPWRPRFDRLPVRAYAPGLKMVRAGVIDEIPDGIPAWRAINGTADVLLLNAWAYEFAIALATRTFEHEGATTLPSTYPTHVRRAWLIPLACFTYELAGFLELTHELDGTAGVASAVIDALPPRYWRRFEWAIRSLGQVAAETRA